MSKLDDIRGRLEDLRSKAAQVFEEAGPDLDFDNVKSIDGDNAAKAAQIRAWNDEMTDLGKQLDEVKGVEDFRQLVEGLGNAADIEHIDAAADSKASRTRQRKSVGQLFVESDGYKGWSPGSHMGPEASLKIGLKNLFETATGWDPLEDETGVFVDALRQPLWLLDLISQGQTTSDTIRYLEQQPFVNSAATVAEGGQKPEASLAVERVTENVEKIAVSLPVTDEQLADVAQARSFIDAQLGFMVRERLEAQVLSGDGVSPNIHGILAADRAGVQSQALGGDTVPDAVYKAVVKVRVTGRDEPTAVVFHPNDWTPVRLLKTSDGIYIWGAPMDSGPERIWGIQVVQTTGMTENTALVGNFRRAMLFRREGLTMKVGYVNDQFIKNTQTIVAELRAALAVFREASFCQVTGI